MTFVNFHPQCTGSLFPHIHIQLPTLLCSAHLSLSKNRSFLRYLECLQAFGIAQYWDHIKMPWYWHCCRCDNSQVAEPDDDACRSCSHVRCSNCEIGLLDCKWEPSLDLPSFSGSVGADGGSGFSWATINSMGDFCRVTWTFYQFKTGRESVSKLQKQYPVTNI